MECPKCFNKVTFGERECENCGYQFSNAQSETVECPDCCNKIPLGSKICPKCGYDLDPAERYDFSYHQKSKNSVKARSFKGFAIVFFIVSALTLALGLFKMFSYENHQSYRYSDDMGEHHRSDNINAYVGGDAYNYIINGNYATGFFVISMGTLISGVICCATYSKANIES